MNRKRHTRLKRQTSNFGLAVLSIFFATTCAPRPDHLSGGAIRLVKPPVTVSAGPSLDEARQHSAKADIEAARARDAVERTKGGIEEVNAAMNAAVGEANRLRKQKRATENELLALYNRLVAQEKRMRVLVDDIIDAEAALISERDLRQKVSAKLSEAEKLNAAKEAENAELRRLLESSEAQVAAYAKVSGDKDKQLSKLQGQVGIEKGKARMLFYITLGLAALLLLIGAFLYAKRAVIPFRFP